MAEMTDQQFFTTYPDRQARIRKPVSELLITRQRAANYGFECEAEFATLGPHRRDRRRLLIWRVPPDNPHYDPQKPPLLKVPFLLFSDETVEDRDDILLPILHEIMSNARGGV